MLETPILLPTTLHAEPSTRALCSFRTKPFFRDSSTEDADDEEEACYRPSVGYRGLLFTRIARTHEVHSLRFPAFPATSKECKDREVCCFRIGAFQATCGKCGDPGGLVFVVL